MDSVWTLGRAQAAVYPQLKGELEVEVVVVGGGVTGLATALILSQAGARVALLEARRLGLGTTGGSTGNLYSMLAWGLSPLAKKWDSATVSKVVDVRRRALDAIENTVDRYRISCDFARRPLYLGISQSSGNFAQRLEEEYQLARNAGLECELLDQPQGLELPFTKALRIADQAQFNPLHYCDGLAKALEHAGVALFENSPVINIDPAGRKVSTPLGTVGADHIVLATHTPKGINMLQAEMEAYREHGSALPVPSDAGLAEPGIYWSLDDAVSLRSYRVAGQDYLVLVGGKYKTGEVEADRAYWVELEDYGRRCFSLAGSDGASHRWSAQQYQAADLLPYIGRSGHDNVYVATGYAADGLVWSEAAAQIIAHQILGRDSHDGSLFSPRRFTPTKSAKGWLEANIKVARHLTTDHFSIQKEEDFSQVAPGEGKVIKIQGESYAAYRAMDGQLSLLSPVCPHMKCIVRWNADDTSWDCPCHGSRFDASGAVLEGPALEGLEPRQPPDR